jgi:hypothetical protein
VFLVTLMLVPIDRARRELSNGRNIVLWSKFDILVKIRNAGLDFGSALCRSLSNPVSDRDDLSKVVQRG